MATGPVRNATGGQGNGKVVMGAACLLRALGVLGLGQDFALKGFFFCYSYIIHYLLLGDTEKERLRNRESKSVCFMCKENAISHRVRGS